jgi:hypothetical protein
VGLAEFCQDIERLDVDLLEAQTARLISDRTAFERKLRDAQTSFQARLREQGDLLASMIGSSNRSRRSRLRPDPESGQPMAC